MAQQALNIDTLVTVLNEVGAYIFTKDLDGKYTYANKLVLDFFGVSLEELIGKDDYCFFDASEIDGLIENDNKVFSGEIIENEEILVLKKTGEKRHYLTVKKPLYDDSNKTIGLIGISTDITEQKNLEKKILDQKHFLDTILDNVDAYIYMKDQNRVFRYANSRVSELFKLPIDEIIGKTDTDIIPKETADAFWQSDKKALETIEKISLEECFPTEDGDRYYWSIKVPYLLEDNTPAVLGFSTDITLLKKQDKELKEKDRILYQQAKISTMGEMIENIAHQWRQPLSVISSMATGTKLTDELGLLKKEEFYENMEKINKQSQYLSNTIDDFRNFFLTDTHNSSDVNLKQSIEKAIALVKDAFVNSNVKLVNSFDKELIYNCNENLFIQALINILNNARDVLSKIEKEDYEKYVFIDLLEEDENYIIQIKDNGFGIPHENLEKIFEPYFTTKHMSQGTGIGLYMTYQIISNNMETTIDVENVDYVYNEKRYKGAAFNITIPKEV